MFAGHLDLSRQLWATADAVLSPSECEALIGRYWRGDAELAPVITASGEAIVESTRNNTRVMWDDAEAANSLLQRVRTMTDAVPAQFQGRPLVGANPRLRLYRYGAGQRHAEHWDTEVELPGLRAQTKMTLVVYLNDGFSGGATEFPELGVAIEPRCGRALVFQHRVLHEATPVTAGEKFVLRTDVAYAV